MKEIAIAFTISTLAALVLGLFLDSAVSSTAFGVVFPSVIAILEKNERKRKAGIPRDFEPQPDATDSKAEGEIPASLSNSNINHQASAKDSPLSAQQISTTIGIDWKWVSIGSLISTLLVAFSLIILWAVALLLSILHNSLLLMFSPMIIAAFTMLATGYLVGRKSVSGGFLSATIMGSIVGVMIPLIFLLMGAFENDLDEAALAFVVFTGAGVVTASIGGLAGARRNYQVGITQ